MGRRTISIRSLPTEQMLLLYACVCLLVRSSAYLIKKIDSPLNHRYLAIIEIHYIHHYNRHRRILSNIDKVVEDQEEVGRRVDKWCVCGMWLIE